MAKIKLDDISIKTLKSNGIVALADRPNIESVYGKGGLSSLHLKEWFDNLGRILAEKINKIQTALHDGDGEYIGIDNLDDNISSLKDLSTSFTNGSFATILQAYHSEADMNSKDSLATLQAIINEKASLIATLNEAFTDYKTLINGAETNDDGTVVDGAAVIGLPRYETGKKLSDLVADVANGVLAAKIKLEYYGFASENKNTVALFSLKTFADNVSDALQGDLNSGLLERVNNCYTKTQTISKETYDADKKHQVEQNTRLADIENNIGEMSNITHIANDIAVAIKSLNEDIDSLQLGVVPRIMRGLIQVAEPEILDNTLINALNTVVCETTGRTQPNNTDSVQVQDNKMPNAGHIFTYYYWTNGANIETVASLPVASFANLGELYYVSENKKTYECTSNTEGGVTVYSWTSILDGWYLASIYTSPAITEIPSYVMNVVPSAWSTEPDENGLYYITVPAITHGMGSDMSLYVDLRKLVGNDKYATTNFFYVNAQGTVICYTDDKFVGKLIVRVGKAYYTTNTTGIVSAEMEQVNGLNEAMNEKVAKTGGDIGNTSVTFHEDTTPNRTNIGTGETTKSIFGKVKRWFAALGGLAFKSSISNADIASDAGIEASKIKRDTMFKLIYPVGTIYHTTSAAFNTIIKMSAYFGGTWAAWGAGRVAVGVSSDPDFSITSSGGAKRVTLTVDKMPSHSHFVYNVGANGEAIPAVNLYANRLGVGGNSQYSIQEGRVVDAASAALYVTKTDLRGGSLPHDNLQPYITCYMWIKTSDSLSINWI